MNAFHSRVKSTYSKNTPNYWLLGFLLLIPIINGLANITTNYFPPATANPGFFRIILLIVFVLIAYPRAYVPNSTNNFIAGFALYWVLLLPLADNLPLNLQQAPKIILSFLLFPMAYYYINSIDRFRQLMNAMLITWSFFILNFFIGNYFKIGYYGYGREESSLFFGSGGVNISKAITLIYLIVPFYLKINTNKKFKWFAILLSLLAFPVLLISMKRAALLGLGAGFITYLIFTPFKSNLLKGVIIAGLILSTAAPLYIEQVEEVIKVRDKSLAFEDPEFMEKESRVGEVELVLKKFSAGSIKHKLIGTNLIYNNYLYGGNRMLHTDYMALLYGSGLIGFIWFFSVYLVLIYKLNSYKTRTLFYTEGKASLYALIAASMMISIAGSMGDLNLRSLFFLFAGGLMGTARNIYLKMKYQTSVRENDNRE